MSDSFVDNSMNPNRYKFVNGWADAKHTNDINDAANEGYRAVLIAYNPEEHGNHASVVVLMERKS